MGNSSSSDWLSILYLLLFAIIFLPALFSIFSLQMRKVRRKSTIKDLEKKFGCRIITLIHRQESLLGFLPIGKYVSIEDAESILEAIYLTSPKIPIWFIIHTPGGIALAAEQIARALNAHKAGCKLFVPHWAMSGGTLVGLGCKEIVMTPTAILGPVDPQLQAGIFSAPLPAASIVKALEEHNPHRDDQFLALGDVSRKALNQMKETTLELLKGKVEESKRGGLAELLSTGLWGTHDHSITYEKAKELGLPVSKDFPIGILRLMRLYRSQSQASSTEYIKEPYA